MADTDMGEAIGVHRTPTASPQGPVTPKRPPKRPRPETPGKETPIPFPSLTNQQTPIRVRHDTPPTSPAGETSQGQLCLELQSHIAAAVASRTTQIKATGEEVLELVSMISQKITRWEERGLQGAASLGRDIRTLVLNFSKSLSAEAPNQLQEGGQQSSTTQPTSYAEAMKSAPTTITSSTRPRAQPKPNAERPPRLFLRLPRDHPARTASPHATMVILREHLDESCASAVSEIQQVPSGLAIRPRDGLGFQLLKERRELLERLLQGAKADIEQKWAIFVLPNAPQEYTGFDGSQVPITEQMALDEFKLQTGLSPLKFYRSSKNPLSGTLIMAVPETQAQIVPKWINLFGKNVQVKHKPPRARIEQCTRCWDYHNPRTCIRKPRCRICSQKDHTEEHHPSTPEEALDPSCANCCGPFPADHPNCPTRPTVQQGVIQRLSRSQFIAVRKAGARQHKMKDQSKATEPSRDMGSSPTREQPQSC